MRGIALWIGEDLIREVSDAMGPDVQRGVLTAGVLSRAGDRSDGRRMRSLLRVLADEVTDGEAGHTRAAEALADSVVIEMLRRAPRSAKTLGGTPRARDPRVLRAIAQMNESFAEALSVDDLAKTANMSRFHFSRLFRDEVGQAPYQYLLKVRLARAAELLRGGHSSVTEAAVSAGFSDFSRFSRMFKRHTGKLPTEMLREARFA
jgi:AraC family transcriptional regulator